MPIGHVVTFTFRPGISSETVLALAAALDELSASSPGIRFFEHGPDSQKRSGNADYAVTAVFSDQSAFEGYMTAPKHQEVIADLIQPNVTAKSSVQFVVRSH
ncbi:Dabb family protein [Rhodococcus erythropolis]|nr:Dabb family protein [Rhodococcus erythropolis]